MQTEKTPQMLDIFLDMEPLSKGVFRFANLFTSTSTSQFMEEVEEEALSRGIITGYDIEQEKDLRKEVFQRMLHEETTNKRFLYEITVPSHEKRHFIDYATTTYGHDSFISQWVLVNHFYKLLVYLAEHGGKLYIPLEDWASRSGCPQEVIDFLTEYQRIKKVHTVSITEPKQEPASKIHGKDGLFVMFLKEQGENLPYVAIRRKTIVDLYPISGQAILESLAWHSQLTIMNAYDADIAKQWKQYAESKEDFWLYTAVLSVAEMCCRGNDSEIIKMLEFSLMTPLNYDGDLDPKWDSREFDPAWRFYFLARHLIKNRSCALDTAIEKVCRAYKWQTPLEVVYDASDERPTILTYPGIWGLAAHSIFSQVIRDYHTHFFSAIKWRAQTGDLLGDSSDQLIQDESWNPPLHRVIRQDGSMGFTGYPNYANLNIALEKSNPEDAWGMFFVLSNVMEDAVKKHTIECQIANSKHGAHLPGNSDCTCELDRGKCQIASVLEDWLRIQVVQLH